MNVEVIARRVLSEFEEMPGLMLTVRQASRLFGLDDTLTHAVIEKLVASAHLRQTHCGRLVRADRVAA